MPTLKDQVAASLFQTVEQVKTGAGKSAVRVADMYLGDIQRHCGRSVPETLPKFVTPVYVEDEPQAEDIVALRKKREGIFAVWEGHSILAHDRSFGRTVTFPFDNATLSIEPAQLEWKGTGMPAVRIRYADLKGTLVLGLAPINGGDINRQTSIRDRMIEIVHAAVR